MKKTNLFILLLLSLFVVEGCKVGKDRIRFQGKLENITNAEFYAYSEDGAFEGVDTIRIEDGKFVYERKLLQSTLLTLLYPNFTQTYVVVEPGKTVKMKGDASKIGEAEFSGTEQNEMLTEFRLSNLNKKESDVRLAAAQFIRNHATTLAAVALFRKYFSQSQSPDVTTAFQLLDILKKAQPRERAVTYLNDFYRPIFRNGVGQTLPDFTIEDINGKNIQSTDYRGKQLAIVCMGTWQSESMFFLRQLHNKLKKAHSKWECLVVSLDVDSKVLRERLQADSIHYPIICDRQAFESPFVKKLGLHYVPSCMLINAQGKIIQRDAIKIEDLKID